MLTTSSDLTISIVIPVHNGGEGFALCLRSIAASNLPPHEIIVVADGESDGSWRIAQEYTTRILPLPESRGPARARNLGAKMATGEVILFIDSDIVIPPDALTLVSRVFQRDPGIAALFGSYDDSPYMADFLSQYKNLFHHYVHQTACEDASTFWSGCGAVRRVVFQELGGYDENYRRPSIEDIEFGYRLKKAGYRIRLEKELEVKHLKRWGMLSLLRADIIYRAIPWSRLILSEGRMMNDMNLKTGSRISVITVFLLVAALCTAFFEPLFLAPAALFMILLLVLNRDLYRFFNEKRGLLFAMTTVPWNWLYFLYSGVAFAYGLATYRQTRPRADIRADYPLSQEVK